MKEVWNLTCDTPGQKLLLMAIADSERDENGCWQSLSTLQKRCSMSRQGILNQIAILENRGWISVSRGERSSTVYRLTLPVHAMDYQPDKKHTFKAVHTVDQSTQLTSPQNGPPAVHSVDHSQSTQWTDPVHAMDSIPKEPQGEPKVETERTTPAEEFMNQWNGLGNPFPKIRSMSEGRKTALRARMRDSFWKSNWKESLEVMQNSEFCRGSNKDGWIADPEFFLRPDTVTKIMEGKYGERVAKTVENGSITYFLSPYAEGFRERFRAKIAAAMAKPLPEK